jgi:hypothetical protein
MPVPRSVILRVNVKTLLIVLLLALPPILIDIVLVLDRSRSELTEMTGSYLEALAESAAVGVSRFVQAQVTDLKLLASDDELHRVTRDANEAYRGKDADSFVARYEEIDRNWQSPQVASVVSKLAGGPASVSLREYMAVNRSMTRLVVTDRLGAAVAASHKPALYYHGDQAWWISSFGDGQAGAVALTDAHWDPVSRSECFAISVPMSDPVTGSVVGVVRSLVNVDELAAVVANVEPGATGRAVVAKRDGIVVSSRRRVRGVRLEAEELETVGALLSEQAVGSSIVSLRGGRRVSVGFARVGLAMADPDIDWVVLVTQDWDETSQPIESVNFRALPSAILAILLVGAVAVYFTTHRPAKFDPLDELHEGAGGQESAAEEESDDA